MAYFKSLKDGYILGIGTTTGTPKHEITETEYNELSAILNSKPTAPDDHVYRLTVNLEWELHELPAIVEEPTETEQKAKAYDILMGVTE